MDTPENCLFINTRIAEGFNPYKEGEYLVVQIFPIDWPLRVIHRSFDYNAATLVRKACLEDYFSHRDEHKYCELNVIHLRKLYYVDFDGVPVELSRQQDWKIHEDYFNARCTKSLDFKLSSCSCSYPLYWSWRDYTFPNGDFDELWHPKTCLIDDHGREVDNCPNCDSELMKVFSRQLTYTHMARKNRRKTLSGCASCKYYSDNHLLPCAVHPCRPVDDICPDYSM